MAEAGLGLTVVSVMDPEAALSLARNPAIGPLAAQVAEKLRRVVDAVADGQGVGSPTRLQAECSGDGSLALAECQPRNAA